MLNLKKLAGWMWSSMGNLVQIGTWVVAFGVVAWAAKAANFMDPYAPLSWIAAGGLGALVAALTYRLLASGRARWVKSKYDNQMLQRGGLVDPLAKTFENKRIYLNEFCLPSHQWIHGKTFIGCEIIGPTNLVLVAGNNIYENFPPACDALVLSKGDHPLNAINLDNCTFRGCSFHRVTFLISVDEFVKSRGVEWLHWMGEGLGNLPLVTAEEAAVGLQDSGRTEPAKP